MVGTETNLRACRYGVLFIAGSSDFCLLNNRQVLGSTQPIIQQIPRGELLRLRRDVNHSPPSGVEFKNVWSLTCNHPIRVHELNIDNFRMCYLYSSLHVDNSPSENTVS